MSVPKRYEIEKITDIFQIPEESIDDFLVDLKSFYHFGNHMGMLIDSVAEVGGLKTQTVTKKMTWIDDSKHDAKIYIKPEAGGYIKTNKETGHDH